jgi:hypothetical protein
MALLPLMPSSIFCPFGTSSECRLARSVATVPRSDADQEVRTPLPPVAPGSAASGGPGSPVLQALLINPSCYVNRSICLHGMTTLNESHDPSLLSWSRRPQSLAVPIEKEELSLEAAAPAEAQPLKPTRRNKAR